MLGKFRKWMSSSNKSRRFETLNPTIEPLEDRTVPAIFTVSNLDDDGMGSLRQAVQNANAAATDDVIEFEAGLSGTITLTTGSIYIYDDLVIDGPGASTITIDGDDNSRGFAIQSFEGPPITVTISGLTVNNGYAYGDGGGINAFNTNLNLINMTIIENWAYDSGGGVAIDGSSSSLTVLNSTISGNSTGEGNEYQEGGIHLGGGIYVGSVSGEILIQDSIITDNHAANGGGGIALYEVSGEVVIGRTTISENDAAYGGGFLLYDTDGGSVTILDSTISNNEAFTGGGIAILLPEEPVYIINSTISGNSAVEGIGGGIYDYSRGGENSEILSIFNSTIVNNTSSLGGGGIAAYLEVPIESSIIANNISNSDNDIIGSFLLTNTLVEDPGTAIISDNGGNIFGVDPMLDGLADNGGPTQTHALLAGSSAIDAGANSRGLQDDQRGPGFVREFNGAADMGAFEVQAQVEPPPPGNGNVGGEQEEDEEFACPFPPGTNSHFVCSLYHDLLGRQGDPEGFNSWIALLESGHSREEVVDGFLRSPEYFTLKLTELYEGLLGRSPTQDELNGWLGELLGGGNLSDVTKAFLSSSEYVALNPLPDQYIIGLYRDVLGREPAPEELLGWLNRIAEGESLDQIATEFYDSEESVRLIINGYFVDFLDRPAEEPSLTQYANAVLEGDMNLDDVLAEVLSFIEYYSK